VAVVGTALQAAEAPRVTGASRAGLVPFAYTRLSDRLMHTSPLANMEFTVRGASGPVAAFATDARGNFSFFLPSGEYGVGTRAHPQTSLFNLRVLPAPLVQPPPRAQQVADLPACRADPAVVGGVAGVSVPCFDQIWQNAGCTTLPGDTTNMLKNAEKVPAGQETAGPFGPKTTLAKEAAAWANMAHVSMTEICYGRYGNWGNVGGQAQPIPVPVAPVAGYNFTVLLNPADLLYVPLPPALSDGTWEDTRPGSLFGAKVRGPDILMYDKLTDSSPKAEWKIDVPQGRLVGPNSAVLKYSVGEDGLLTLSDGRDTAVLRKQRSL